MRRNNLIKYMLFALLIASAIFTWNLIERIDEQNQHLKNDEAALALRDSVLKLKDIELSKKDSLIDSLLPYLKDYYQGIKKNDSVKNIIKQLQEINVLTNNSSNSSATKQAEQLESEGFNAILANQFNVALSKFITAEKTSPSFHMCYEISKLLKNRQADFGNQKKEEEIKIQIYKKYSWKAPKDLLFELGEQLAP